MKIWNLTPHPVNLYMDGTHVEYPTDGPVPRDSSDGLLIEGDFPFEAVKMEYGDVYDLPDPEEGLILIMSNMNADARPTRTDLWFPAQLIRDAKGGIVECDGLICLAV